MKNEIFSAKNLKTMLDLHEVLLSEAKENRGRCLKLAHSSKPKDIKGIEYDMPKGSRNDVPFDQVWEAYIYWNEQVGLWEAIVNSERMQLEAIEKAVEQLDNTDYKVVYYRDVMGLRLVEIAKKIHMTYDWVREVSARNPRKSILKIVS